MEPPRLQNDQVLAVADVAAFLLDYNRYTRNVGPGMVMVLGEDLRSKGAERLDNTRLRLGLEQVALGNRDPAEVNLVRLQEDLREELLMDDSKSAHEIIPLVSESIAKLLRLHRLKGKFCPRQMLDKGLGIMAVQLLL